MCPVLSEEAIIVFENDTRFLFPKQLKSLCIARFV
jgi:hypothetical protein